MSPPTLKDINRFDSLDEREAVRHFLGKSLEEALALFAENSLYYQENLMWMGPRAFRFYVQAAVAYLESDPGGDDIDMLSGFAGILEYWIENEPEELRPISIWLIEACETCLRHLAHENFDPGIHGDLPCRFEAAKRMLADLRP